MECKVLFEHLSCGYDPTKKRYSLNVLARFNLFIENINIIPKYIFQVANATTNNVTAATEQPAVSMTTNHGIRDRRGRYLAGATHDNQENVEPTDNKEMLESARRRQDDTTAPLATETQPLPATTATVGVDKNHNATGVVPNAWNNVVDFKLSQVDGSPKKRRAISNLEQDSGAGDRVVDNDADAIMASAKSSSDTNQKVRDRNFFQAGSWQGFFAPYLLHTKKHVEVISYTRYFLKFG